MFSSFAINKDIIPSINDEVSDGRESNSGGSE